MVEHRKLIALGKLDGVSVFTMTLSPVTVIDVANRKDIFCATQYQLTCGPVVGDHCFKVIESIVECRLILKYI